MAAERLAGSDTGVFVGISASDYGQIQLADPALGDAYAGTGGALSIAANRLSYVLDLRGPSLAIDTACSSSLVAVHLACQSLRAGECAMALAGGVNLILSPDVTVNFSPGAASCRPAGAARRSTRRPTATCAARAPACVVLKRLSRRALADGDRVLRGDPRHGGEPGRPQQRADGAERRAQEAVLREALPPRRARTPASVQYVEAHGTGTPLGDPIEARALGAVVGAGRAGGAPCRSAR